MKQFTNLFGVILLLITVFSLSAVGSNFASASVKSDDTLEVSGDTSSTSLFPILIGNNPKERIVTEPLVYHKEVCEKERDAFKSRCHARIVVDAHAKPVKGNKK